MAAPAPIAFRSRSHPDRTPAALVYARALTEPLAWGMTGVMIAAGASILSAQNPLPWLIWVVPVVCALAVGWTVYDLRRTPAEIVLVGHLGTVRSVWDVALGRPPQRLHPVFSPKRTREGLNLPLGRTVHTLGPEDWADFERLEAALFAAAEASEQDRLARATPAIHHTAST